ncbi:MAG: hypothetical protein ASARMPREDX12_004641 [Alectoria sarmentosa]|nr:MAG: hypothetical protein ASARMPREDX12_004641 [Alectoria sarmentosa]
MALLAGSSIQPWLTFDGTLPLIQPCRFVNHSIVNQSITNPPNGISLFEPTNSDTLVTCGLWSTLVSSLTYDGLGNALLPPNDTKSLTLLKPFNAVGLDLDDIPYTLSYADEISDCLPIVQGMTFFLSARTGSAGWASTVSSLRTCMSYICNPVTLNPDLAGIGVFSSFVIQSGIAVFALAALIIFELLSPKPEAPDRDDIMRPDEPPIELQTPVTKRKDNLITALVEFHKAQCYSASTIQITALILFDQNQSDISVFYASNEPIFDKTSSIAMC